MSDTPETDQFYTSFADGIAVPNQDEWLALCSRLERERDEARAEAEKWRDTWSMTYGSVIPKPKLPWEK